MKITARENGPYVVEVDSAGGFEIRSGNDVQTFDRPVIALCRCGQSASKPLCDGTHKQCGFTAAQAVITTR